MSTKEIWGEQSMISLPKMEAKMPGIPLTYDSVAKAADKVFEDGLKSMQKPKKKPPSAAAAVFVDKDGNRISHGSWCTQHEKGNNNFVRISKVGNILIVTEWFGLQVEFERKFFRTVSLNVATQVPVGEPKWSGSLMQAKVTHTQAEKAAVENNQLDTLPNCPICGSQMAPRYGRWGLFYGCSQWSKKKCPGKRNADGSLTKDVVQLVAEKEALEAKQKAVEEQQKQKQQIEADGPWGLIEID